MPKTAELVATRIRRQIIRGELAGDDVLPTENELMAEFGISRPTLREAFRVLEAEGLIVVRRGSRGGARVQAPSGDAAARYAGLLLQHRGATLDDVFRGRGIVEPPAARMVASRRDHVRCARRLEERLARDAEDAGDASFGPGFHRLLVELTGNQTLLLLTEVLESIQEAAISAVARSEAMALAAHKPGGSLRAHARVIELIRKGEGEEAEASWRRHLEEVDACLLRALGSPKAPLDVLRS
ncbi:MAG TPA: GntR family transcriptional regulator [Acidimicrobiia bacterium]|nr:GntR family transcriptional regulator [Acidimicrobiia bacterium]